MNNPIISIVIPVYNTVEYVEKCISSIINQTYSNLEIICVDDGSTDGSGMILDGFCRQDSRVKVIHQDNQGESKARNIGLDIASGSYVTLVDSDDWLETDMYEKLIDAALKCDADMAIGGWVKESLNNSEIIKNELPIKSDIFTRNDLLKYLYIRDKYRAFAYMWNKIYRRDLLNGSNYHIRFNENLSLGGDVQFLGEMALKTKTAVYVDKAFYHYRQMDISMCHTDNLQRWRDWIRAYEILIDKFQAEQIDKETINYLKRFLVYHSCEAAEIAMQKNDIEQLEIFKRFMKLYKNEYYNLNNTFPERLKRYEQIILSKIDM